MRIICIFLTLFFPAILFGQLKTKKVFNKITEEEYYVLESNANIKQGEYKAFKYKKLIEEGIYDNNKRQGKWISYSNGKVLKTGNYKDDVKIGEWNFYDYYGKLEQTYDYSKRELIYQVKNERIEIKPTGDFDVEPILIGGWQQVYVILRNNIIYPNKAKDKSTQGKVYIEFTIDEFGKASDYKIKRGIGDGCDEESLRVAKLIPNEWIPAMKDGKAVSSVFTLPIEYKLN